MTTLRAAFALVSLPLLAACSTEPLPIARTTRTVDVGRGYVATLSSDGSLSVTRDGAVVLETAADVPLVGVYRDPELPDAWHDPTASWPFAGLPLDGVKLSSPRAGELHLVVPEQDANTVLVSLALALDDGFYGGLGERFDHADARGTVVPLFLALTTAIDSGLNEAHVPIPFFVSSKGYGVFVETRAAGAARVGAPELEPGVTRLAFEGRSLDVTFFFDPDPLAIVAAYTRKTGLPKLPPRWALAPMHWRNEWENAHVVLEDAMAYRERDIPASCLWIDNPWQTAYNTATLDPARFGDTKALMTRLAELGFRPLAWSTPYLERPKGEPENLAQELYLQAADAGHFVLGADGAVWSAPGCCHEGLGMMDFTDASARAYWKVLLGNATGAGFAGFKLDYGEDLVPQFLGSRLAIQLANGETDRTAGRSYPLAYHRTYREALAEVRFDGFLIGRASGFGGQTEVDCIWPGDLENGFQRREGKNVGGLPAAVVAAQSLAMSGFPTFGSDTGGYRGGQPTREVLLRWAEHTAFSVVMQLGGAGEHHNPWLYDDEAGVIYAKLARAHMQLVPYLSRLVRSASTDGTPTVRPLALAYPDDVTARAHGDDEYLLGPDLLVAPILDEGSTKRVVHFPEGSWVHYFTDALIDGPADVELDVPLGTPAVFLRAGAVLPQYPDGIDTLVESTEPGVTTLAERETDVEARVVVRGPERAVWEEGSSLEVDEEASTVTLRFAPNLPVSNVVARVDLRRSVLGGSEGLDATLDGAPLAPLTTASDVRASSTSAYAIDGAGTLWVKLVGLRELALTR